MVRRMLEIFVDADACPVKDEVVKVAERHGMTVHLVGNSWIRGRDHPLVRKVVVAAGPDAADDWIAGAIGPGDIVVTADVPLAARCIARGAKALGSTGKPFTEDSIGGQLAMRDLLTHLRETGEVTGGPASFATRDRSRFLDSLERVVQAVRRGR